jgi:hypothetical protein
MNSNLIIKQLDNTTLMELGQELVRELSYRDLNEWEISVSRPNGTRVTLKNEVRKR